MEVTAAIALGSNLGDSAQILRGALLALDRVEGLKVVASSPWYRTAPVGPPQPDYLNGCALLKTTLDPEDLLNHLLGIEQQFGRVRRERWGPRSLDLDLLFYGDRTLDLPHLTLPHPRMGDRPFVLVPLADIAPHWQHPHQGETVIQRLAQLDCQGVELFDP
ncbi:MAG: 2-amino-4-hydroxy-6-hydroxymethyldihydropteridine diphosphokinase [Spirulina sp. DLM2.Bin59]|nr:MAG: 2-amino-4-hydroxy-6-hydroxymethyldihydropteridine diphosphokinase [Spirulina sp. DLM2.Bin59]